MCIFVEIDVPVINVWSLEELTQQVVNAIGGNKCVVISCMLPNWMYFVLLYRLTQYVETIFSYSRHYGAVCVFSTNDRFRVGDTIDVSELPRKKVTLTSTAS